VIEIDGSLWFVGALLICGAHVLYLRGWRRERRVHLAWRQKYDADSQQRHEEFMCVTGGGEDVLDWNLDGGSVRGQA
jgi:hypothetical protein